MSCPKNLPNVLTVIRAVLVPVFMVFLCFPIFSDTVIRLVGASLFGAISLTDMLDGKLARKYHLVSDFGKFLDPLADKLLVLGAMLALIPFMGVGEGRINLFGILLIFATFIVILRELAVTSLRLLCKRSEGTVIAANMAGKVKTVSQIIFILAALLEPIVWRLMEPLFVWTVPVLTYASLAVMVIMTIVSGINYFRIYLPLLKESN